MARNKLVALLLMLVCLLPFAAKAAGDYDFASFRLIPVIHEGRVKPLGRMAQITLKQISNIDASSDIASAWLASILFDPAGADDAPVFHIPDAAIRYALSLPEDTGNYYSFRTLDQAFVQHKDMVLALRKADFAQLAKEQQNLLALYARTTYYEQLKESMTLALPLRGTGETLMDKAQMKSAHHKKFMQGLQERYGNNQSFRVIPAKPAWMTPWQVFIGDPARINIPLGEWRTLAAAYIHGDSTGWEHASRDVLDQTLKLSGDPGMKFRLQTEIFYSWLQPYLCSMILYALGVVLTLIALKRPRKIWNSAGAIAFAGGIFLHVFGMACRMVILHRPPVSNLYESFLFVGAMIVCIGIAVSWVKKEKMLLVAAGILGVILHGAGFALSGDDDTLKVLQAVLDTKFWLATHVIIITGGYAMALVTSAMAHLYMLVESGSNRKAVKEQKLYQRCVTMSLVALLLVSTGTLLGGVWADQSWGRFWGWDPKENGALLIVLWLVWLLHGKISRHINDRQFIYGLAALILIVALSWLGINLLGIGLHSYGFISGSMASLAVLFVLEAGFFAFCLYRQKVNHAV